MVVSRKAAERRAQAESLITRSLIKKYRAQLQSTEVLIIDDLFLRRLPQSAGEELADVLMSRYEKLSTVVTSNRPVEDWATLLGDVVVVTPLLDRLMHLLKFEGKKLVPERIRRASYQTSRRRVIILYPAASVGEFDPARDGGL